MGFFWQRWRPVLLGFLLVLAGLFVGWQTRAWLESRPPVQGAEPSPPPEEAPPFPPLAGDDPQHFTRSVYFDGLFQPVAMAFGTDGSLYVAQADGTLWALEPPGRDGRPRNIRLLAAGLPDPQGVVVLKKDDLLVRGRGGIWRVQGSQMSLAVEDLPMASDLSYGLLMTRDRRLLWPQPAGYQPGVLSGSVLAASLDGALQVFASGLGRPRSLALDDETGALYVLDQPQVAGPANLFPLQENQDYGWPLCTGEKAGTLSCSGLPEPLWTFSPEGEIWGLLFYTGGAFPPSYQRTVFLTLWGDPTGKKGGSGVVVAWRGSQGTWHLLPFSKDFWHATALAVDKSGNLYVADMGRGDIVRFSPSAQDTQR